MPQFRTLIIAAQDAPLAREIAEHVDPLNYSFMWLMGLSSTGQEPATNYISTGYVSDNMALMVPLATLEWQEDEWVQTAYYAGRPDIVVARCAEVDLEVTEQEVADLFSRADSTAQDPWVAIARLGLQQIRDPNEFIEV
jgi:hypothetical protein